MQRFGMSQLRQSIGMPSSNCGNSSLDCGSSREPGVQSFSLGSYTPALYANHFCHCSVAACPLGRTISSHEPSAFWCVRRSTVSAVTSSEWWKKRWMPFLTSNTTQVAAVKYTISPVLTILPADAEKACRKKRLSAPGPSPKSAWSQHDEPW